MAASACDIRASLIQQLVHWNQCGTEQTRRANLKVLLGSVRSYRHALNDAADRQIFCHILLISLLTVAGRWFDPDVWALWWQIDVVLVMWLRPLLTCVTVVAFVRLAVAAMTFQRRLSSCDAVVELLRQAGECKDDTTQCQALFVRAVTAWRDDT